MLTTEREPGGGAGTRKTLSQNIFTDSQKFLFSHSSTRLLWNLEIYVHKEELKFIYP